jgi:hypothetical protein
LANSSQNIFIATEEVRQLSTEQFYCNSKVSLVSFPQNSLIVAAEFVWPASQSTVSLFLQNSFGQLSKQQYHFD